MIRCYQGWWGSKQTNHRGNVWGALTIFGCLSRSQGSRYWGKERKGKGAGQQLRSGPGSSASSREPSPTSSAFIVPFKALKLWLPSQEISLPGRELQYLTMPLPIWRGAG